MRIGTRGSALARWQAEWVAGQLNRLGIATELVLISTSADQHQDDIAQLGITGAFTRELQRALLECRIELAVHSLKDLPTLEVPGLALAAVPPRETPFDVLICRDDNDLASLPRGSRIATSSPRRRAQVLRLRPDVVVCPVRGNVDTRLRKLDEGQFDGLVLAQAGLARLGFIQRAAQVLAPPQMYPAPGQGALALEVRSDDQRTQAVLRELDDPPSRHAVTAERTLLARLGGGCHAAVGALARPSGEQGLILDAVVLSQDGQTLLSTQVTSESADSAELGGRAAEHLLQQGAARLLAEPFLP
jgi:hydroxymethylbilane synthase